MPGIERTEKETQLVKFAQKNKSDNGEKRKVRTQVMDKWMEQE